MAQSTGPHLSTNEQLQEMARRLMPIGRAKTYPGGILLQSAGDRIDGVSIVKSGRIQLSRRSVKGDTSVSVILGEGEMYGAMAIFLDRAGSHNVETIETTEIVYLDRALIWQAIDSDAEVRRCIITFLSQRLSLAYDEMEDMCELPLPRRVAKRLLLYANKSGRVNLTQAVLADDVSASRYGVGSALQEMQQRGLIKLGYRYILLTDIEGLTRFVR